MISELLKINKYIEKNQNTHLLKGREPFTSLSKVIKLIDNKSVEGEHDYTSNSFLHLVCKSEQIDIELLSLLINSKLDVNKIDKSQKSPLIHLCENKNATPEMIEILLINKASINLKTQSHENALHLMCSSNESKIENIFFLLENKIKVNTRDSDGNTPLHRICENTHINMVNMKHKIIKSLVEHRSSVDLNNNKRETALSVLCTSKKITDLDLFIFFLDYKADLNVYLNNFNDILDYICLNVIKSDEEILRIIDHPNYIEPYYYDSVLFNSIMSGNRVMFINSLLKICSGRLHCMIHDTLLVNEEFKRLYNDGLLGILWNTQRHRLFRKKIKDQITTFLLSISIYEKTQHRKIIVKPLQTIIIQMFVNMFYQAKN